MPVVAPRPVAVAPAVVGAAAAACASASRRRRRQIIYRDPAVPAAADRVPAARSGRRPSGEPALVIDTSAEIPIGTLIPAVLETPIDTSRPGLARAIVARDVRGLDGQRVLVARGSRLIGEYQSDVRSGQNRVLVNWTRLVRPDGSSSASAFRRPTRWAQAGIPGRYHSFFLKRFFNAALQTAMTVGGNALASNNGQQYRHRRPAEHGQRVAGQGGQGLFSTDIRPKITIKPGTLFNVFVARELDLSGTTPGQ